MGSKKAGLFEVEVVFRVSSDAESTRQMWASRESDKVSSGCLGIAWV